MIASDDLTKLLKRIKRKICQHKILARTGMTIFFLLFLISVLYLIFKPIRNFVKQIIRGPKLVSTFFTDPLYTLPSYNGITNLLVLGMGGEGHDGALLTDTMILFSLNLKTNSVSMISIPRDIWVPSLEAKINSAYMIGEEREVGGGFNMIEDNVYEIIDMPIHYIASIDFNSFKEIIDVLGGIEITVEKSFTDKWYPIAGLENDLCNGDPEYRCRYETLIFEKGKQIMNGEMALKFSRSRHAEGEEGTDFARSQRQQKVIAAIKDKILSKEILLNLNKVIDLKNTVLKYLKFNKEINDKEVAGLASFGYNFWREKKEIKTIMLETGDNDNPGFLFSPIMEKYEAWVLEPRSGDWQEFQKYLKIKVEEEI